MTKGEAVQHLKSIKFGLGNAAIEAAVAYAEKKNPVTKQVKATVAKTEAVVAWSDSLPVISDLDRDPM